MTCVMQQITLGALMIPSGLKIYELTVMVDLQGSPLFAVLAGRLRTAWPIETNIPFSTLYVVPLGSGLRPRAKQHVWGGRLNSCTNFLIWVKNKQINNRSLITVSNLIF